MTTWLLYFVITVGGSPAVSIQPFTSESECKRHVAIAEKRFGGFGSSNYSYCEEVKQ